MKPLSNAKFRICPSEGSTFPYTFEFYSRDAAIGGTSLRNFKTKSACKVAITRFAKINNITISSVEDVIFSQQ